MGVQAGAADFKHGTGAASARWTEQACDTADAPRREPGTLDVLARVKIMERRRSLMRETARHLADLIAGDVATCV